MKFHFKHTVFNLKYTESKKKSTKRFLQAKEATKADLIESVHDIK